MTKLVDRTDRPPHGTTNAAEYLLGNSCPDALAVIDGEQRHTYRDLRRAASKLAAELAALDLEAESRVAVVGVNSFFWVAAYLAVIRLGHVAVPISDKLATTDVRRNLDLVGCTAALATSACRHQHSNAFTSLRAVITEESLHSPRPPCWPTTDTTHPDDDAVLMFTSGTTAQPRAVRVTHRNIRANTDSIISYLGLVASDRALVVLPFFYCFGASVLHTHLRVGASTVLGNSFVFPEAVVDLLDRERCTVLAGVPSSFQLLLRAGSFCSRELPSLRLIQQAGGKLPPVIVDELLAAKPHARLFVMYGATEATARLSYLPPERLKDKPGSIGRGIPGVDLKVLDDNGNLVPPGVTGEIYAVGENISPGYYGAPEESASKFTDRGLRTGDLAMADEEGYLYVVDRKDDFIKSWGHRISSQEVEACAMRLPDLVSAAAVGVPDDAAGEAVALFVVTRPGSSVTPDDVLRFCRAGLPRHMVPRSVDVLAAVPLNGNGKVAKRRLRELAMEPSPALAAAPADAL